MTKTKQLPEKLVIAMISDEKDKKQALEKYKNNISTMRKTFRKSIRPIRYHYVIFKTEECCCYMDVKFSWEFSGNGDIDQPIFADILEYDFKMKGKKNQIFNGLLEMLKDYGEPYLYQYLHLEKTKEFKEKEKLVKNILSECKRIRKEIKKEHGINIDIYTECVWQQLD